MFTKEEILNEIRRTTKQNGGKPLGRKSFTNETGIGIYDYLRYWPKWGDALIEAGFLPNEPYTKYPEGVLEEYTIALIREKLKRYPTMTELRVEGTVNRSFPYRAIQKKGLKFVRDLVRYCEKTPGHDDILKICQPIVEKLDEKEREDLTDTSTANEGYVYLFKADKFYKIGHSKDPVRRGKEIKIELPYKLKFIHEFKTDDPVGLEKYWHTRFKDKRQKETEFFRLNPQDVRAFKRWKRIY